MNATTKESFINPTVALEDSTATSLEPKPLVQGKLRRNTAEKENGRATTAKRSHRALFVLVIAVCLFSLAVLLLLLLMLFGKIGDECVRSVHEASSADPATMRVLEEKVRSLQLGLMEHLDDLAKLNKSLVKAEAGYSALRHDLNMARKDLLLITDNITVTSRLEYLYAFLTRLNSALNATNTDLAELKSTQTKEKVIYHQTMTPSWLEAHASYINSYRLNTTEQLTFISAAAHSAALLKVPVIPANLLQNSTMLTVKIVVCSDVDIGAHEDSDIIYGMSDGKGFVGFETDNAYNYGLVAPCFGNEGSSGTTLTGQRLIASDSPRASDSFYPGQFVITLKLDAHENWGSCYTAHDGGFVKIAKYNNRLMVNKGLTLEVYKDNKEERAGIKYIEVTVIEDL